MKGRIISIGCAMSITAALLCLPVISSAAPGDDQKALAKSQYMLRQVSAEKAELEKKNKELEAQLTAIKADAAKTQKLAEIKQEQFALAEVRNKQQIEILQSQKQDTLREVADVKRNGSFIAAQKGNVEGRLAAQKQNFAFCIANNNKLAEIGRELLGEYANKGFGAVLRQKEPFTGKKQVEIEKLTQDYQYRLDDAVVSDVRE